MLKGIQKRVLATIRDRMPLIAIAGVTAFSLGAVVVMLEAAGVWPGASPTETRQTSGAGAAPEAEASVVLALIQHPPTERANTLQTVAADPQSPDQSRARYLLATDLINQGRGGAALPLLDGLDQNYPPLAPLIGLKRAQAQAAASQTAEAKATWQAVVQTYGDHPAAAEALYRLGESDPSQWDQLLTQFPAHPRSVEVALKRLAATPTSPATLSQLRIVAKYGLHRPEAETVLDRLTATYASQLTPEDWQTIGFGYWELQRYGKAGDAYAKAAPTALTVYRAARGKQLGGKQADAIATYQRLATQFPSAPEAAEGLIKLSRIVSEEEALKYLDQVVNRFPDRAGEALLERADLLDQLQSASSASQVRASILKQYSASDAAANIRMKQALANAKAQNFQGAMDWGQQLVQNNPESELAPEAGFWVGKWALKLGQQDVAKQAFEQVIGRYPESYYAWRSAVMLGWDVGDFTTVRTLTPQIVPPAQRSALPTGSETLQELYRLGQDQDAWALWQVEFTNRQSPTVAEQFTDGLMRLGVADHLDGIYMVSSLAYRDLPEEQADYQTLKQQDAYWHALYPFPFSDLIETWATQRQLNPLLVIALIRQESRFEPKIRSAVGATGLMQVMPDTAEWIQFRTDDPTPYNLENPEDNIKLGTWYLDYTHREYDNHSLYAVASYNAGPGNIAEWIDRGGFTDADDFVEQIPFAETKGYVYAVFGGYWNYLRLYNPQIAQQVAQYTAQHTAQSAANR